MFKKKVSNRANYPIRELKSTETWKQDLGNKWLHIRMFNSFIPSFCSSKIPFVSTQPRIILQKKSWFIKLIQILFIYSKEINVFQEMLLNISDVGWM